MPIGFISAAIIIFAVSGIPGLFFKPASPWIGILHTILVGMAVLSGFIGLGLFVREPIEVLYYFPWPNFTDALVGLDALTAFFLVPILLIGFLGALYAQGYWPAREHPRTAGQSRFFWGLILSGMTLMVISRHSISFLLGWETMALAAFFLVTTEDDKAECRKSGLIYIIATHTGTLLLFALFSLWNVLSGSFELLSGQGTSINSAGSNILFALAFIGFGLKAGIMPLHFWLPGAHANAPSHVSALLSGVMLKMGIYGIVRMAFLLPNISLFWGWVVLFFGIVSGILGVAFALAQHDLKRLLAYHSVENIGIILLGLGLALLGRAYHRPLWVALGMAGALLHVWNHSIFKSLLFFGAGSVLHGTGTRLIDRLGGLGKKMPLTSMGFLVGAVAISGLPPLNGFISEFFIYTGFFKGSHETGALLFPGAFGAPALAIIGALAVACFVKVYSAVFLGNPRSAAAEHAHEASASMGIAMAVLSLLCVFIGIFPQAVLPILQQAVDFWGHSAPQALASRAVSGSGIGSMPDMPPLAELVPLSTLSAILGSVTLGTLMLFGALVFINMKKTRQGLTWDCGYARPTNRMQYTAGSFARTLVQLFRWVLKPQEQGPHVQGPFPDQTALESHVDDLVLDRVLIPDAEKISIRTRWFYRFQQGMTNAYIMYIILFLIILLLTLIPYKDLLYILFIQG